MFDVAGRPFDVDASTGDGEEANGSDALRAAVACLAAGVERADPGRATREAVSVESDALVVRGDRYALAGVDRVLVVGAGKGADRVAAGLVDALDGRVDDGVVVVDEPTDGLTLGPVRVRVGDHPVPSERGVAATREIRDLVAGADASTLVLVALAGGASALLAAPVDAVALEDLQDVTRRLLDAGASIGEVNAVRKHVSTVKGGRLAVAAAPARVVTVAVSDVVGDDPAIIGSGPTAPDGSTFADALDVLSRYDVDVPAARNHLEAGVAGDVAETASEGDAVFEDAGYHVVASARTAVAGALDEARRRGFESTVLSTTVMGEASESGGFHAAIGREVASAGDPLEPPAALFSAGENTVTVRGDGTGGPNQEFVLGAALALADGPRLPSEVDVAVAAVDTDGRDGSTEHAGAVLTGDALADASLRERGRAALSRNDAGGFFDHYEREYDRDDAYDDARGDVAEDGSSVAGGRLLSGATGTNVNDLRVVVVDDRR